MWALCFCASLWWGGRETFCSGPPCVLSFLSASGIRFAPCLHASVQPGSIYGFFEKAVQFPTSFWNCDSYFIIIGKDGMNRSQYFEVSDSSILNIFFLDVSYPQENHSKREVMHIQCLLILTFWICTEHSVHMIVSTAALDQIYYNLLSQYLQERASLPEMQQGEQCNKNSILNCKLWSPASHWFLWREAQSQYCQ